MGVKGHLRSRGIEFDVVYLTEHPSAIDELSARGLRSVPVLVVGDNFVPAGNLRPSELDELVGLARIEGPAHLPVNELARRVVELVDEAIRCAKHIPADRLDDVIPALAHTAPLVSPEGTPVLWPDGTPFVPTRSYIGLVRHIVGHAAKFQAIAQRVDVAWLRTFAEFVLAEEPSPQDTMSRLEETVREIVPALEDVSAEVADVDYGQIVDSIWGPATRHDLLAVMARSTAQHTRQLFGATTNDLGLSHLNPLDPDLLGHLGLSDSVWD